MIAQVEGRTKVCKTCGQEKALENYYLRRGKKEDGRSFRNQCKTCENSRGMNNWIKHYTTGQTLKSTYKQCACPICEENEICCLVFHHIDPCTKVRWRAFRGYTGGGPIKNAGSSGLLDEISKCIVLCENCHRKYHAGIIEITELHMQTIQFVQLYQFLKSQGIDVDAVLRGEPGDASLLTPDES